MARSERARRSSPDLLRMKDLVSQTGLTRDTIHFYIAEGLVPAPTKKRRNMAWYDSEHLDRLNTIKRLQQERFLPLRAIKEVLTDGGRDTSVTFTEGQRRLIDRLRMELTGDVTTRRPQRISLVSNGMAAELGIAEIDELAERGVIELDREGGDLFVSADDADILAGLVEIKRVIDRPEGSWRPEDWQMLDRLAAQLIDYEISVFAQRFPDVGTKPIDEVVDTTVPIINRVFGIFHLRRIRRFVLAFTGGDAAASSAHDADSKPAATADDKRSAKKARRSAA